jgi:hypothetical protein
MAKMVDLPDTVRIGPFDVAFEIKEGNVSGDDEEKIVGDFSQLELVIRVKDKFRTAPQHVEVVIHELLHAMWMVWNLKDGDPEERVVSAFAVALTQCFRDNPRLVAWIDERLGEL